MKRTHVVAVAVTLVAIVVVLVVMAESQPRLTILVNGSPAANITVTDIQTASPRTTDATGTLAYGLDRKKQNAVFVPIDGGGQRLISFPVRGHKTVDLRGRYTRSKTVVYHLGILRADKITEEYDLTDAEMAALKAGNVTMAEVQEAIRGEAEPSDATERRSRAF